MNKKALGGYFELELPKTKVVMYPQALSLQSGRAAFSALLQSTKPKRVWLPNYICDSILAPLDALGVPYQRYSINEQLSIADDIKISDGDLLYYVNYFGICSDNIDELLGRFNPRQVVLDYCQAFFCAPRECLAVIYSPRKFFGVPDGGLLVTEKPINLTMDQDRFSAGRSGHLIRRLVGEPESGYAEYLAAEQSLAEIIPRKMSVLTEKIFASIDYEAARMKRNENFQALDALLGGMNSLDMDLSQADGPLCYPLYIDVVGLREHLLENRIFVATYWPDVLKNVSKVSFEASLVKKLVPLPCDQRYDITDMQRIADTCSNFIKKKF